MLLIKNVSLPYLLFLSRFSTHLFQTSLLENIFQKSGTKWVQSTSNSRCDGTTCTLHKWSTRKIFRLHYVWFSQFWSHFCRTLHCLPQSLKSMFFEIFLNGAAPKGPVEWEKISNNVDFSLWSNLATRTTCIHICYSFFFHKTKSANKYNFMGERIVCLKG